MRTVEVLNPRITWRSALLMTVACGVAMVVLEGCPARRSIQSKLRLGLTEPDVVRLLGEEPARRYSRETAPTDYYVEGWSRRERPITGSVLVFILGETICYVWFDEHGRVEDLFVGGS